MVNQFRELKIFSFFYFIFESAILKLLSSPWGKVVFIEGVFYRLTFLDCFGIKRWEKKGGWSWQPSWILCNELFGDQGKSRLVKSTLFRFGMLEKPNTLHGEATKYLNQLGNGVVRSMLVACDIWAAKRTKETSTKRPTETDLDTISHTVSLLSTFFPFKWYEC